VPAVIAAGAFFENRPIDDTPRLSDRVTPYYSESAASWRLDHHETEELP